MNILLIGSGGRENAIAKGLYESEGLKKIFCTPVIQELKISQNL